MEEKIWNGYLQDIYENNETINRLIEFEDFVDLVINNCTSREDIMEKRMYEFEELVVHNSYKRNCYSENYDEEKDVEINYSRRLSFSDIV